MNRQSFVLSWGRKLFFGIGWPLLCLVAFSYFQSQIVPTSALGIFYYLVTTIGHYGLLTAVIYFVLYAPLAILFPNYYFTRLWSMFLIMGTGLFLFVDSIVFSLYQVHINLFIIGLFFEGAGSEIIKLHPSVYILTACLSFAVLVYIWYRGESTWRHMQRRFSNANKNWYLVLIAVLVIISHVMHIYGDAYCKRKITRFAQNFPMYFPATAKRFLGNFDLLPKKVDVQDDVARDFNYPSESIVCNSGDNKSVLLITVDGWSATDLSDEKTPLLMHYSDHGTLFTDHHSASDNPRGGLFSIFYALPETYLKQAQHDQVAPILVDQLQKRGYGIGVASSTPIQKLLLDKTALLKVSNLKQGHSVNEDWRKWIETHLSTHKDSPFFGLVAFDSPEGIDGKIGKVIDDLFRNGLLNETLIIITGNNGGKAPEGTRVPLLWIWPRQKAQEVHSFTSHYDIVPTLMTHLWGCKTEYSKYSDGHALFNEREKDWFQLGSEEGYLIIDYKKGQIVKVDPRKGHAVTDFLGNTLERATAREDVILTILRNQNRFRKKVRL
jgi:membrane-anchored protein YejM (alkaline phosphatase superfamily)